MLAAPVSRVRVCDACRMAAEQLRSRSRPCLTTGPTESGATRMSLFEVRLEDDRQTSNLLAFPVLYVAYRSESSLTFFSLFRARLARRGSRRWYPLRGGLPDPARNGQVPLAGRQPPGPPRHPPPGDPRPARGVWGGGGPAGGEGGEYCRTSGGGEGWVVGSPPLKNPPFLGGVKNRCFLGKPPNLPTVSRG